MENRKRTSRVQLITEEVSRGQSPVSNCNDLSTLENPERNEVPSLPHSIALHKFLEGEEKPLIHTFNFEERIENERIRDNLSPTETYNQDSVNDYVKAIH